MKSFLSAGLMLVVAAGVSGQGFEARSFGMGGTGVASSLYHAAPLFNPALLARGGDSDDFGLLLPVVGAVVADEDDLINAIDSFQASVTAAEQSLATAPTDPATVQQLADLAVELQGLGGRVLNGAAGAGFVFSMPGDALSFAIVVSSKLDARSFAVIDPNDVAVITLANDPSDLDNIASEGIVTGAAVTDVGLAIAYELDLDLGSVSIGVTPKYQRIDTYNYSINVTNYDRNDFDDSRFRNDDNTFNLDVGAAAELFESLVVGVVARNVIPDEFRTVVTNSNQFEYQLRPLVTLGAAYAADVVTLAVDVDLTKTRRFFGGADDSQYLRLGAEVDVFDTAQLRVGFENDMEGLTSDLLTAGFGFSPFGAFRLDLAGAIGEGDTYGGVLQTSFTF